MDKVIGLGHLSCLISEELTNHPEYRVYKIMDKTAERGSLELGVYEDISSYEELIDAEEVAVYLRSIKKDDEVLFIVEGGDPISGSSLRVLETIQDAKITVLYICPDTIMASSVQKRDHKIVCGVLQEYARSGAVNEIILINKSSVEVLVGDVPIHKYEQSVAYFISYLIAMINYFNHTSPIIPNTSQPEEHCRIATFGVSSFESKGGANLLFPLSNISDVHFYYGVPHEAAESDTTLMSKIKTHTKEYKNDNHMAVNFSVYGVDAKDPLVLCVAYTKEIQNSV